MKRSTSSPSAAVAAATESIHELEASKPLPPPSSYLSPLGKAVWGDTADSATVRDVSAKLTWRDLTVTVTLSNGNAQRVLEGLTGYAVQGTITVLMGPSGSGKSTLLDALAGRLATNAFLSGDVLLNGRKTQMSFGTAAYVTQDDTLIGTLTVKETIMYSANLRLPNHVGQREKRELVDGTIIEMGLQDCADNVIGNWHLRGISGGEKRRVTIAVEILTRPRLLFLDEPTSGLDSASAFFVTQMLRGLSRDGRTVIASIHQPSSEVFELFDHLYLLSGGRTIYFGKVSEAHEDYADVMCYKNPGKWRLWASKWFFNNHPHHHDSWQLTFISRKVTAIVVASPLRGETSDDRDKRDHFSPTKLVEQSQLRKFFREAGFPCPALRNPSDHFLRCINSDFDKVKATLKGSIKVRFENLDDPLEKTTSAEAIRTLLTFYNTSRQCEDARHKVDELSQSKGTVLGGGGSQASFLRQSLTLTKRSFVNMSRDFGYYWLRLVMYIVLTICIGTIFYDVGTSYSSILARGASASFVFGFLTFLSIGGFPSFVEDMKVFQRERLNGHYGVVAFVISNTLSAMPFLIMISVISGSICYYMVKLHPGFIRYLFFVLSLYASVTVVESLMMAIASVVPNFLMGIIIGAGIQGIFMLVCGYFRRPEDLPKPVWRYPMSYISFHYWALQGQYQNDLRGLFFDNQSPDLPKIPGEYILEHIFQVDMQRSKWINLLVVFAMIPAYRIIFFIMIKFSEDVAPWIRGCIARRRLARKGGEDAVGMARMNRLPSLRNYVQV